MWFPVFWLVIGLTFLLERNNPNEFYTSIAEPVKYAVYIFAVLIGLWSGFTIFKKCDINPTSDRGIFSLKLLSVGILVAAVLIFVSGMFFSSDESVL